MFNYVCRLDNEKLIKMYGYCDFTGQFNETIYTQISCENEQELPNDWQLEKIKPLSQTLLDFTKTKEDVEEQAELIKLAPNILDCMANGLITVAEHIINTGNISKQTKDELLALLG